jgi:hypothetical protein
LLFENRKDILEIELILLHHPAGNCPRWSCT